ncbi:hypothetical protein M231_01421 [Tremella mesenterica]|uniref:Uncharacterized protein n=1 Tax=Tremella mesenterica TaxID=5217 RepID=A0A4Q1BT87_TREME|nr:hypothetical protein M231_01421 [Tremella mesenterica]
MSIDPQEFVQQAIKDDPKTVLTFRLRTIETSCCSIMFAFPHICAPTEVHKAVMDIHSHASQLQQADLLEDHGKVVLQEYWIDNGNPDQLTYFRDLGIVSHWAQGSLPDPRAQCPAGASMVGQIAHNASHSLGVLESIWTEQDLWKATKEADSLQDQQDRLHKSLQYLQEHGQKVSIGQKTLVSVPEMPEGTCDTDPSDDESDNEWVMLSKPEETSRYSLYGSSMPVKD